MHTCLSVCLFVCVYMFNQSIHTAAVTGGAAGGVYPSKRHHVYSALPLSTPRLERSRWCKLLCLTSSLAPYDALPPKMHHNVASLLLNKEKKNCYECLFFYILEGSTFRAWFPLYLCTVHCRGALRPIIHPHDVFYTYYATTIFIFLLFGWPVQMFCSEPFSTLHKEILLYIHPFLRHLYQVYRLGIEDKCSRLIYQAAAVAFFSGTEAAANQPGLFYLTIYALSY